METCQIDQTDAISQLQYSPQDGVTYRALPLLFQIAGMTEP